jgi:RHS repeat-associated protein
LTRNDSEEGNTTYDYDLNDRLLEEITDGVTTTYTYDNNGNTLSKTEGTETVNYQWDGENRLIGVDTDGDGTNDIVNQYDGDGIRVSQTVNGEETRFLVDKNRDYAQVLEEYTPSKIIKAAYVYGNDLISQVRDNQRSFYHVDGLGSTRALTDLNGAVTDSYAYEAFGEIIKQLGNTNNLYLFAGEQRDPNIGLDYLRARYYNQQTGRFTSRDIILGTLLNPVTQNRYTYVYNNPVIWIDPSGNIATLGEVLSVLNIRSNLQTTQNTVFLRTVVKETGCLALEIAVEAAITEGVYILLTDLTPLGRPYVGQSRQVNTRVQQHIDSKISSLNQVAVKIEADGFGRTQREILEQLIIDKFGGIDNLENIRNPVSSARRSKFKNAGKLFDLC